MTVGPYGKRRLMGEINVVPYIDVMLVLLIIFMITAPLLTQGVRVNLPRAAAQPLQLQRNQPPIVLSIDARGRLYLNIGAHPRQSIDDETALIRATVALRRDPQRPVLVNGDRAVDFGRVVQAMVLLQQAGAREVGFQTQSPPSGPPAATAAPALAPAVPAPDTSVPGAPATAAAAAQGAPAAPGQGVGAH